MAGAGFVPGGVGPGRRHVNKFILVWTWESVIRRPPDGRHGRMRSGFDVLRMENERLGLCWLGSAGNMNIVIPWPSPTDLLNPRRRGIGAHDQHM